MGEHRVAEFEQLYTRAITGWSMKSKNYCLFFHGSEIFTGILQDANPIK